jgi:rod shape-determining protein MreC
MRDSRRTRLVLAVLLLVSFTLVTLDIRGGDNGPVSGLRSAVGTLFGPVQRAAAAVVRPISGVVNDFGHDKAEVDRLKKENDALKLQLRTSELERKRAAELDSLLKIAGVGQYRVLPAQIIAVGSAQGFAFTATIDAGSRDGLKPDMTVINGEGLVGRIKSVSNSTATVVLANDPTSSVGARLEGNMELAIATGQGKADLELQVYNPQAAVAKGARVVTFGSKNGNPFVPGVPIGEVQTVRNTPGQLTRVATVKPYVNFTALDLVGVVIEPPRQDPRDSVLPPKPAG